MVDDKMTGIMIYYYFVCKRKLWFFVHEITMEEENEEVQIGKAIDELTYVSERKHISIQNEINIDLVRKRGVIHEIKKSRKIEKASIWQVKYYLYYLKQRGVQISEAMIDYPLLKQTVEVALTEKDENDLRQVISEAMELKKTGEIPAARRMGKCNKCAFCDLCFS